MVVIDAVVRLLDGALGEETRRPMTLSATGCWNIRIIRVRRCFDRCGCRKYSSAETTAKSPDGEKKQSQLRTQQWRPDLYQAYLAGQTADNSKPKKDENQEINREKHS
jgi:hypothetical protein